MPSFVKLTRHDVRTECKAIGTQQQRPKPSNKRLFVEMTQIKEGEVLEGPQTLFEKLAKDVRERNPENKKTVICLMDGQRSLWAMQEAFLSKAICILDLMHVMERLWKAAHCLHPQTSIAAEAFVQKYLRMMLEGKLGYVIGAFKRKKATLSKEKERQLENVINYFETNRQYMNEIRKHPELINYYERVMVPFEDSFFGDHEVDKPFNSF